MLRHAADLLTDAATTATSRCGRGECPEYQYRDGECRHHYDT